MKKVLKNQRLWFVLLYFYQLVVDAYWFFQSVH
jgi:hypothetical protein